VLYRHDLPPADVGRQVSYVGGAGPLACQTPHQTRPHIALYARGNPPNSSTRPEIGEILVVCTDGFSAHKSVHVALVGPGRRALHEVSPGNPAVSYYRGVTFDLLPGLPLGAYRIIATQGTRRAISRFTLSAASKPGLRVVRPPERRGDSATILGVDLPEDTMVHVYRQEPDGDGTSYAYIASFPAKPRRDGTIMLRLTTSTHAPPGCWVLTVDVRRGSAEDQLCIP
jgi:hypothetical protein